MALPSRGTCWGTSLPYDELASNLPDSHIGLPLALTNQNGETVWSSDGLARPYGDITASETTDALSGKVVRANLRLPGQYDDGVVEGLGFGKLFYNWNRWYAASQGRYLESDPVNPGSIMQAEHRLKQRLGGGLRARELETLRFGGSATSDLAIGWLGDVYLREPARQALFAYGLNNPLLFIDATGTRVVPCESNFDCWRRNMGFFFAVGGLLTGAAGAGVGAAAGAAEAAGGIALGAGLGVLGAAQVGFSAGVMINCVAGTDTFSGYIRPPPRCCGD